MLLVVGKIFVTINDLILYLWFLLLHIWLFGENNFDVSTSFCFLSNLSLCTVLVLPVCLFHHSVIYHNSSATIDSGVIK